jgi:hypothetical protein
VAPSDTTYVIRPFLSRKMALADEFARYTLCIHRCEQAKCPPVETAPVI